MIIAGNTSNSDIIEKTGDSDRLYRLIFERASDAIFLADETFHYFDANDAGCKLFERSREEIKGMYVRENIHPDDIAKEQVPVEKLRSGETVVLERRFIKKDGTHIFAEVHIKKICESVYQSIIRDITGRIKTENDLEKKISKLTCPVSQNTDEIKFEDLFNLEEVQNIQDAFAFATGVASVITRTDGVPITRPSNFCHLCENIIRKTEKGLKNCYHSDAVLGQKKPDGPIIQKCLSGGLLDGGASICVGERHIANWLIGQVLEEPVDTASMLKYAKEIGADEREFEKALGKVTRMPGRQFENVCQALFLLAGQLSKLAFQNFLQAQYITEKKRVEDALIITKDLAEAASRAKSNFMATMSHELRTPMNGIIGFSKLLSMGELNPEQREFNEMIRLSSEHLLEVINDILDFSKLEAKKLKLQTKTFDIRETIKNAAELLREQSEKKNITLIYEIGPEIIYDILGDQLRLKQIIINLLSNAVKFTNSGEIRVCAREMSHNDKTCVIAISVSDTGIGIPSEKTDEIFEMFHQLDDSNTRRHGGAGLGLSIVKGLVEMMNGIISVKSEHGKGSTFTVNIPFEKISGRNNASTRVNIPGKHLKTNKTVNILLAEDDEISIKLVIALARKRDWKISVAVNGIEAFKKYLSGGFDIILMDGQMPEMNGFEAAKKIREHEKSTGEHIPIIALTAYALEGDREKFIAAGMDDYISKPFETDDILTDKIKKYT